MKMLKISVLPRETLTEKWLKIGKKISMGKFQDINYFMPFQKKKHAQKIKYKNLIALERYV